MNSILAFIKYIFISMAFMGLLTQTINKAVVYFTFKINQEYIAKNLCEKKDEVDNCCKGSCHLTKELAKEEKKESTPGNNKDKFEKDQIVSKKGRLGLYKLPKNGNYFSYVLRKTSRHKLAIFHPPDLSV